MDTSGNKLDKKNTITAKGIAAIKTVAKTPLFGVLKKTATEITSATVTGIKAIIRNKLLVLLGVVSYAYIDNLPDVEGRKLQVEKIASGVDTIYKTSDTETNAIIHFMAGFLDNDMKKIFKEQYGYNDEDINKYTSDFDPILYKTIRQLHERYGSPRLSLGGSASIYETDRPRYSTKDHKAYLINAKALNIFQDTNSGDTLDTNEEYTKTLKKRTRKIINNRIAELSHSADFQKRGAEAYNQFIFSDGRKTLKGVPKQFLEKQESDPKKSILGKIRKKFQQSYDKATYHDSTCLEHHTHKVLQPELVQDFLDTYKSSIDTTNGKDCYNMAKLYYGFFDGYIDQKQYSGFMKKSCKLNHLPALEDSLNIAIQDVDTAKIDTYYTRIKHIIKEKQSLENFIKNTYKEASAISSNYKLLGILKRTFSDIMASNPNDSDIQKMKLKIGEMIWHDHASNNFQKKYSVCNNVIAWLEEEPPLTIQSTTNMPTSSIILKEKKASMEDMYSVTLLHSGKNIELNRPYYEKLAKKGDKYAMFILGEYYYNLSQNEKNNDYTQRQGQHTQALVFLKQSADKGHSYAVDFMANIKKNFKIKLDYL